MNILSIALAANYSAILSLNGLNIDGPIGMSLSDDQTSSDTFILYGTLDSAAVDNTNAWDLGRFSGGAAQNLPAESSNMGNIQIPRGLVDKAKEWPFLLVRRTGGSTAGTFIVSGDPAANPAVVSVAAPAAVGAYSGLITLTSLGAKGVRLGGSAAMTTADQFDVFLSNDATLATSTGAWYAGRICGGGGDGALLNSVLFKGFAYARVQRVAGSTAGNILAAGVSPDVGGGSLNLTSLAVGDTAAPGAIGALTAAQSVDIYSHFVLTQTTAGVTATLPNPTNAVAGKVVFVHNNDTSTQAITMYGMTIQAGAMQPFSWDGSAWGGGRNITQGGNAFAADITIGSTDDRAVSIISGTGAINIGADAAAHIVTVGNAIGTTAVTVNTGTGASSFAANATDHSTTIGSVTGVSLTAIQGGTGGITLATIGAASAVQVLPRGAGAGETGIVAFRELAANGTDFVGLRSPDLLAASFTFTLPNSTPTISGQQLESTSTGNMSWGGMVNVIATNVNAQTIADGAAAADVTTWTEVLDTAAAFDPAAGTFTVPAGAGGLYEISASLQYAATAADLGVTFDVNIELGGAIQRTNQFVNPVAALAQTRNIVVTAMLQLAVGNVITISTALSANGGTDIALTASALFNFLSISRISA